MKTQTFQITYVEFDFDGEDEMDDYDKDSTTAEVIGTFWEAIDEDDLVEEVISNSIFSFLHIFFIFSIRSFA